MWVQFPPQVPIKSMAYDGLHSHRPFLFSAIGGSLPTYLKNEPFHGICFEGNDPYAKVQIRLFGWLVFRVHFLHLSIDGPQYEYTHQLDSGDEDIDVNND